MRAAEYVRMSTEHQQYSTENQDGAIRQYAARRGLEIVRTYADAGKSGLAIDGREGLQRLIDDVQNGRADYSVILVYDVSRWGRFQDADESAYYEYLCRRAGVQVEYCAEPFSNDGSMGSDLQKMIKRKMAGEYSRELSHKVFAGQCRLIELGFRQGGPAGYGLRRQMIGQDRRAKCLLGPGERKSLQTDRVILVPGPDDEVETVRRVYRAFVQERRSETEIAALLNAEGKRTDFGRPWTRGTVHQLLSNEKYIGANVYNRVSCKLKGKRVVNRPEMWIRADGAFAPLVDPQVFQAAQALILARSQRLSDLEMLERLKVLLAHQGYLSGLVIDECEGMPSSSAYRHRFGSLVRAYSLIGYHPRRDYRYIEINRRLRELHPRVVEDTLDRIRQVGGRVVIDARTDLLRINEEFTVSLVLSRCHETPAGARRWVIRLDAGLLPDVTVAVRMAPGVEKVQDYYLLPAIDMVAAKLRLAEENGTGLDVYRFGGLDALMTMAERVRLREVPA
ncbi:recombinase family protein [Azospirillum rugosum]|nr:recombinase family protein [Azospirillum rugosum]